MGPNWWWVVVALSVGATIGAMAMGMLVRGRPGKSADQTWPPRPPVHVAYATAGEAVREGELVTMEAMEDRLVHRSLFRPLGEPSPPTTAQRLRAIEYQERMAVPLDGVPELDPFPPGLALSDDGRVGVFDKELYYGVKAISDYELFPESVPPLTESRMWGNYVIGGGSCIELYDSPVTVSEALTSEVLP